ncbi:hypothetical protein [Paraburkholderia tropica]|uniref:hypothetical protein n=1 Tax=Paraburkholderia tropica TaxID=92647 RepID=UPI002ABE8A9A|nr:hypothetical protein [Paraburkholderia tropica]
MNAVIEGARSAAVEIATDMIEEAYAEGAFFAETDWQAARRATLVPVRVMPVAPGYSSMADHCRTAWDFIRQQACPEWDRADTRFAFFLGYEEAAKVLAAAGEAGYETLAEAGTVEDTEGWVLHSQPWADTPDSAERAARAMRAAWTGAACWAGLVEGGKAGTWRAEQADEWALEVAGAIAGAGVLPVH